MKRATRYEILRGVSPTSRTPCIAQPSSKPVRIAFLIDEAQFVASGGLLEHHKTIFLEDALHDWMVKDGKFYYYGHAMGVEETGDIVAVLEMEEVGEQGATPDTPRAGEYQLIQKSTGQVYREVRSGEPLVLDSWEERECEVRELRPAPDAGHAAVPSHMPAPADPQKADMARAEAYAFSSTNEPTALLRHWFRKGFAMAVEMGDAASRGQPQAQEAQSRIYSAKLTPEQNQACHRYEAVSGLPPAGIEDLDRGALTPKEFWRLNLMILHDISATAQNIAFPSD